MHRPDRVAILPSRASLPRASFGDRVRHFGACKACARTVPEQQALPPRLAGNLLSEPIPELKPPGVARGAAERLLQFGCPSCIGGAPP